MRNLSHLDAYRVPHPAAGMGDAYNGCFQLTLNGSRLLFTVVASNGGGWDHVSVSTRERCPRWDEMKQVKDLFFESKEAVMQLFPPESEYVDNHPYCLHLWRPQKESIPLPPKGFV